MNVKENERKCQKLNGIGFGCFNRAMACGKVIVYSPMLFITACFTYHLSPGQLTGATGLLAPQPTQKPGIVVCVLIYLYHIYTHSLTCILGLYCRYVM
jgi:hypothetical protein